ncbi:MULTISPECIES: hypothetical protein [Pararhodobacter]|uniref:DUF4175 domain-containing protein n=1 Tax=Pararhodobacter aggregans TaxID=404875 RepID=A0A2T7UVR3_9RHOB|nr:MULTISPECIES: hypothetical protein [Pararhodobacter]PTW99534.1 hypothetical protein C8N33_11439 [Pararhodobacter aggregans]PVE48863.1 hypothetical protein DDE23_00195 [Pararhodobacter aggregans]
MTGRSGFAAWLGALAVLVFLGAAVPYGPLAGSIGWSIALFWGGFGLAVIVLIALGAAGWRDR